MKQDLGNLTGSFFLDAFDSVEIRDYVHELQPKCLVTRGEMATPEQKIPDAPIPGPWESCLLQRDKHQVQPHQNEQCTNPLLYCPGRRQINRHTRNAGYLHFKL